MSTKTVSDQIATALQKANKLSADDVQQLIQQAESERKAQSARSDQIGPDDRPAPALADVLVKGTPDQIAALRTERDAAKAEAVRLELQLAELRRVVSAKRKAEAPAKAAKARDEALQLLAAAEQARLKFTSLRDELQDALTALGRLHKLADDDQPAMDESDVRRALGALSPVGDPSRSASFESALRANLRAVTAEYQPTPREQPRIHPALRSKRKDAESDGPGWVDSRRRDSFGQ